MAIFLALLVRLHSPIECYRCLRFLYWGVPGGARAADRIFGDSIFRNFLGALPQLGRAVILCQYFIKYITNCYPERDPIPLTPQKREDVIAFAP